MHQTTHIPAAIGTNPNGINYNITTYGPHLSDQPSPGDLGLDQKDENASTSSCSCSSPKGLVAEQSLEYQYKQDPHFPREHLASLEDKINNPRWIIPVLPEQELEILLDAAIELCRAGNFLHLFKIFVFYSF